MIFKPTLSMDLNPSMESRPMVKGPPPRHFSAAEMPRTAYLSSLGLCYVIKGLEKEPTKKHGCRLICGTNKRIGYADGKGEKIHNQQSKRLTGRSMRPVTVSGVEFRS